MRSPLPVALVAALVLGACSDGGGSTAAPVATPFTIWVFEERLTLDAQDEPLANVRVAFDPPDGGERVTRTTGLDGHVTFEGDFTGGGASVTVLSDEHVYLTMLEASPDTARARPNTIGKPAADLVVFPPRFDSSVERSTVELRGNISGKRDPDHVVTLAVGSVPRLGSYRALESTYALRAPKGRPFFLLGYETKTLVDKEGIVVESELLKAFRIELPARTDDQKLDLDLTPLASLPTKLFRVRAEVPQGSGSPFGGGARAFATTASADSRLTVAPFARSSVSADGRVFDVEATLVDTDIAPERLVSQVELVAPDGSRSVRRSPGVMTDGMVWKDFPVPPTIPDPEASRALRDAIPLDGFPPGADLVASLYAGGRLVWLLNGPPGGPRKKTFTVPYRDEIGQVDVQIFALSLSACTDRVALSPRGELCRAESTFRDIHLRKR